MADTNRDDAKAGKIVKRLTESPVVVKGYTSGFTPSSVSKGKAATTEVKKGGK